MAEFETKLRRLSERGSPVGAEEMIERIEAELAGDPLVVLSKRREGTIMTKTQQPPATRQPSRNRGPAWALAAFVIVLALGGLYLAFTGNDGEVADNPPPTTVAPNVETMTDLEIIEAGVEAFYSGDAERAAELFELTDHTDEELRAVIAWQSGAAGAAERAAGYFESTYRTDDEIRAESAYQAAISGRVNLSCTESPSPWSFMCRTSYQNAMTDAIGAGGGDDEWPVVVEDGVITQFGFTEHTWILESMGTFLASEGRFEGYEDCLFGPLPEPCATIQLENLDAWTAWYQTNG